MKPRSVRTFIDPRKPGGLRWWHHGIIAAVAIVAAVLIALAVTGYFIHQHYQRAGGFIAPHPTNVLVLQGGPLPASWSLNRYVLRIHYQGASSSCVGQSLAEIAELTDKEFRHLQTAISSQFLWNQLNGGYDQGIRFDLALNLAQREGQAPLASFPYDDGSNPSVQPAAAAYAKARSYRLQSWRFVQPSDRYTIESEIHAGRPVFVGWNVYDGFYNHFSDCSPLTSDGGNYHFGHGTVAVAYNSFGLTILNSWGPTYGCGGRVQVSWSYLATYAITTAISSPVIPRGHVIRPFPLRIWSSWTRAHRRHSISPYRDRRNHLTFQASIWRHHKSFCGGVVSKPVFYRAHRRGHHSWSRQSFVRCQIITTNHPKSSRVVPNPKHPKRSTHHVRQH